MKKNILTKYILGLRNKTHRLFPKTTSALETLRQSMIFRKIIEENGFQMPLPPFVKRSILKKHIVENNLKTLVETGTQYGDTPWFFREDLSEIWSIELSPFLARIAQKRFKSYSHIHIIQGDSSEMLPIIIANLNSPTLFWLDGHYSAGLTACGKTRCPIFAELNAIFKQCKQYFIILIDDARLFGVEKDYPSIYELEKFVAREASNSIFSIDNDIIQISHFNSNIN